MAACAGVAMHGSHPLHSTRLASATVRHSALVQYVFMLAEHVAGPCTAHGPQCEHDFVADDTSPVVEHSKRWQSARNAAVHCTC